jgi:hypothetical protein
VNQASSISPAVRAPEKPETPATSTAEREVKLTTYLVVGALLLGLVLQVFIPPGGLTLVAAAFLASMVVLGVGYAVPGRLRQTIAGFRFIATLLFVLAVEAILGTLILQLKPAQFYLARYGAVGKLIVALRLDDIFHGLPFALLMALFGASVIASATLRWPVKVKNLGFFIAHVGLMTSLAGAGASATLAIRGRIDLHAGGETATHVRVTRGGQPTGEAAALGFDLHLDRFELVNYEPEYRIGYYEQAAVPDETGALRAQWRLKASFDPDLEKHRLPSGDSFRVKSINDQAHAIFMELQAGGIPKEGLLTADRPSPIFITPTRALIYERREKEVKAYVSHVSAHDAGGHGAGGAVQTKISVNDPMTHNGWTLYQVNYNPEDPTYSGLDAVYDPGVAWVFLGFGLICLGVFYMFYLEPRLKGRAPAAAKA